MNQKDEFSKWISTIENALSNKTKTNLEESMPTCECDCGNWDCKSCFPDAYHQDDACDSQELPPGQQAVLKIYPERNSVVDFEESGSCGGMGAGGMAQARGRVKEGEGRSDREPYSTYDEQPGGSTDEWNDAMGGDFEPNYSKVTRYEWELVEYVLTDLVILDYDEATDWYYDKPKQCAAARAAYECFGLEERNARENQRSMAELEALADEIAKKYNDNFNSCQIKYPGTDEYIKTISMKDVLEYLIEFDFLKEQSPQKGTPQMEKVDKDVAAMLRSLKKYDQLVESVAPVLGMKTLSGKNVKEGWQHDPTQGDRSSYGGSYDRDIDIMRDEQTDSEEAMIDFIQDKVSKLLKKYEDTLAEVGVYGNPDPRKIAKLLCDPEFDMAHFADELHDELDYLDQDGEFTYRAEPHIEDLMSDLEYIADEIKGNRMYEDGMDNDEEIGQDPAAKKIFDKIKGTPNLNTGSLKKMVASYLGMVGKTEKHLPMLTADVATMLQDAGLMEDDMEEGNEFSGKLADAKRDHKKNFTVGDKTYPVREEMSPQSSYASVGPAGYAALMKMSEMPGLEIDPDEDTKMATVTVLSKLYPGSVKALQGLMQQKLIKPIAGFAHREVGARPATGSVNEQADPEVLAWMNRFAKLGNMKGYGR